MLELTVGFPTGRYYAASHSAPEQPEWPPHPSRAYSALVAAAYGGGRLPTEREREALRIVEAAGPPAIRFPKADVRPAPDTFVPVNDPKSRYGAKSHGLLNPLLQARQFPAAFFCDTPEISYFWELDLEQPQIEVLDALAQRMTHMGTSHSLCVAHFRQTASPSPTWIPHSHGDHFLRVPRQGRLEELDALAASDRSVLRRPPPQHEVLAPYQAAESSAREFDTSRHDWIGLRIKNAVWGADCAYSLGRSLRRAVMAHMGDKAPAQVHGHASDVDHVAWVPLPDVGHMHANGRIRGAALLLPRALSSAERTAILIALARIDQLRLDDGQSATIAPVVLGEDAPIALRETTWRGPSRYWSTVTPVVLDRPPKHQTPDHLAAALVESLAHAGYPAPASVHVSPTSDFTGAPTTGDIPTRIPRVHARIVFDRAIEGPIIAGRWRHFGVGLFRPTPEDLR